MSPAARVAKTTNLFSPIKVGNMLLNHRVVMAPMTRLRTTETSALLKVVKEYYSQRASTPGTFLISEGTVISPRATGFPGVPGIWSDEQIATWKEVVDAVHAKGSYIYLQVAAMGRAAQPSVLQSHDPAYDVVGAGDIPMAGGEVPRPITVEEIQASIGDFVQAATNAVHKAGFDGVELHGANGFLIDQFIQDVSNNRTDKYGGSIENRVRFALEVVDAVAKAIGEDKTAIRLSPWSKEQDMGMKDPIPTFTYLISQLKEKQPNLAYLHLIQSRDLDDPEQSNENFFDMWSPRPLVVADGITREKALKFAEREGLLVAFGRQFISNPDLPLRLKADIPLSEYDRTSFYGGDESGKGYIDYSFASK
ncbi:NADH:flavin oxidoreductase/NADH oxidase [Lentinula lateritia]|uniref:NADH:flavin oxidoreductase/NADH oxidase n=1 Tax=Lentinula aff. lateritia TaxID=2804960 RepID=A0ACC1UAM0_9AGAR|nr:NADH:flavin oxidoreductase/NADH oxidase [Lentinula aff. lateritia]KAJ3856483.1 NADH:flavin oxidoreductase/NADH oxidase [Lentinula lateritia]